MPYLVLAAEALTLAFFIVFCALLAFGAEKGPIFAIGAQDPVARALLRSAQSAFVVGYGAFFVVSLAGYAQ